jgi:hypothetical protein
MSGGGHGGGDGMTLFDLTVVFGVVAAVILGVLAAAFWRNPLQGMTLATHRLEMLPRVMADRYTAFAFLAVAVVLFGDLRLYAVLFTICAFMGLVDGLIYARAGHPHLKHTASGVLSAVALVVSLTALAVEKGF